VQSDADLLGLVASGDAGHFRFVVEEHLARMDARLYGGTAIAVSVTAAELVSQRQALWMTTQFVSTIAQDEPVDVHAEVLAPGKRTNQVRVTGTGTDGTTVFASLGATGIPRDDGLTGFFEHMPAVSPPDDSQSWTSPFSAFADRPGVAPSLPENVGFTKLVELRGATIADHPDPGPGRVCVWARRRDGQPITPAVAAFIADMVPMSVAHGFGVFGGGTSLDNTIRVGAFEPCDWVLLDLRAHGAVGDYGHGVGHVWSPDGRWLATASQTASMRHFDPAQVPWAQTGPT
jgi:acyl-CoA thioesterase